jgi:hypothetical protein
MSPLRHEAFPGSIRGGQKSHRGDPTGLYEGRSQRRGVLSIAVYSYGMPRLVVLGVQFGCVNKA